MNNNLNYMFQKYLFPKLIQTCFSITFLPICKSNTYVQHNSKPLIITYKIIMNLTPLE